MANFAKVGQSDFSQTLRQFINFALICFLIAAWFCSTIVTYIILGNLDSGTGPSGGLFGFVTGIYLSRWLMIAALLVFLPGSQTVRVIFALLLFGGEAITFANILDHSNELVGLLILPLLVLSLAIPFELVRILRQAHIYVDWLDVVEPSQLGLRELFLRVTYFVVLFGILQFFGREVLLRMLGFCLTFVILCSILILPYTIILSRSKYRTAFILAFLLGTTLISVALIVFIISTGMAPQSAATDLAGIPIFIFTVLLCYGLGWLVLGRLGFEFRMGHQSLGHKPN
ncbi:MAG: hypothetical protein AAGA30_00090 [Planctomycetota bacterium]